MGFWLDDTFGVITPNAPSTRNLGWCVWRHVLSNAYLQVQSGKTQSIASILCVERNHNQGLWPWLWPHKEILVQEGYGILNRYTCQKLFVAFVRIVWCSCRVDTCIVIQQGHGQVYMSTDMKVFSGKKGTFLITFLHVFLREMVLCMILKIPLNWIKSVYMSFFGVR